MASLLDGLKNAVIEMLRPGTQQQLGERESLRQLYDATSAGAVLPNTWYRLHNQNGGCVGFSYSCNCRMEYQLLSAFEWMRDYKCSQCGAKFDLLKYAGIKNADGEFVRKPEEWEALLAKLPIRPRLAGRQEQRVFDTWSESKSDAVAWGGNDRAETLAHINNGLW
jgi:hypothetical protein